MIREMIPWFYSELPEEYSHRYIIFIGNECTMFFVVACTFSAPLYSVLFKLWQLIEWE